MTHTADMTVGLPDVLDALHAVGHPLRARILLELRYGQGSPNALAGERITDEQAAARNAHRRKNAKIVKSNPRGLGATLGTIAYHFRWLDQRGMIELVDETRVRGAVEHHYAITQAGLDKTAALAALGGGTVTITP